MPTAKPSTSPEPTGAAPITRPKGVVRASLVVGAVPAKSAAVFMGLASATALSFLQILLAGLFGIDKNGEPANDFAKALYTGFQEGKSKCVGFSEGVFSFSLAQFKEAMSEICGQEDFVKHQSVAADVIKQVETLTPEKAQEILDDIDARAELNLENERAVGSSSGQELNHHQ